MKLRFSTPLITAFAALLLLASCSKTNKEGRMVPKEAGFVLHINSKSIFEKLNVAELKQTDWYKQMMEELHKDSAAPEFAKKLHENLSTSGIDSTADMIIFGQKGTNDRMNVVFEGGLRDATMFETFLKNIYPKGSVVKDGETQSMAIMDHAVVTWDKEKFAMGILSPEMGRGMHDMGRPDFDSMPGGPRVPDNSVVNTESPDLAEITMYCKNLFTLKEDNSLSKDEKFTDLMKTEGDIHAYISIDNLIGGADLPLGMLSMIKLDAFTKGNIATYTANFDKGKITVKARNYMGKELSDLVKKYSGGKVNTDMIKNIPSENVVGVFAFHFKPEGLKELVKLSGVGPIIDLMLMRQGGFGVDDFVKANKGDVLLLFSDLKMKTDSTVNVDAKGKKQKPIVFSEPDVKVLFSAAIDNKEAFNKLISIGKTMSESENDKMHYKTNDKYFAIGNDATMVDQYIAGGNHNQPFLDKISGNAIGGFADIQRILKAVEPGAGKDSLDKQMWSESVKMWDNAVLTGGDYSGGGYNQQFELNLMDKNTNSLKQLFQYTMTMSAIENKRVKKIGAEYNLHFPEVDSTKTKMPPPPSKKKKK